VESASLVDYQADCGKAQSIVDAGQLENQLSCNTTMADLRISIGEKLMRKPIKTVVAAVAASLMLLIQFQSAAQSEAQWTVKEVMNAIITPMTTTIWGAYQLETDAQWQQVENAALTVIAAGNLLASSVSEPQFKDRAAETAWQGYNTQMINTARQVIAAVANKDEEALSSAGNDALYPPCESCHQDYQAK
jgi:hypothetical protein